MQINVDESRRDDRSNYSVVPSGTHLHRNALFPAVNGWAIYHRPFGTDVFDFLQLSCNIFSNRHFVVSGTNIKGSGVVIAPGLLFFKDFELISKLA